jgi:T-complex protein 1 subunit eta|mmetsp:Transcript_265/g.400  ORF Transcript_265/g.400 Transcript_265/m.400 type:complete len:520 (-) Transcript_265:152-1711(-)
MEISKYSNKKNIDWGKFYIETENSQVEFFTEITKAIKSTLGPSGMEKFLQKKTGEMIITNDGATILNNLIFFNPISKIIVEVAKSQDFEIGDGTTSVCLFSLELLMGIKSLIKDGIHPKKISNVLRKGASLAIQYLNEVSKIPKCTNIDSFRRMLISCCATSLNSKLISGKRHIFSEMIVDIGLFMGSEFDLNMISVKGILGGNLTDSFFLKGIIIKKPFSYAGYEKQKKKVYYPIILLLDIELEIKTEKDQSETKITKIGDFKVMIDVEWSIMYEKLDKISQSGAKVVFSKKSIGDLATQYFSEREIICGGRIFTDDLSRISKGTGAQIISSCFSINPEYCGKCKILEEKQIGNERFIVLAGCPTEAVTIVIRGGNRKLLDETKRCLNDGIMVMKRVIKNRKIVGGAGSIEMKISSKINKYARNLLGAERLILSKFAKSFEIIPKTLCENAGIDFLSIVSCLKSKHCENDCWLGVDIEKGAIFDTIENFIWEPINVKINSIQAATEVVSILSTIGSSL